MNVRIKNRKYTNIKNIQKYNNTKYPKQKRIQYGRIHQIQKLRIQQYKEYNNTILQNKNSVPRYNKKWKYKIYKKYTRIQ